MRMKFEEGEDHYFFSQPHQPFFILAFVNAIIIMLIFMLAYKGVMHMAISPTRFHAYGLIYLLFTPAFFGFLFTTFPRFSATAPLEKKAYMDVFNLYYLGASLYILGSIATPVLSVLGMGMVFAGHLRGALILKKIYTTTQMEDRHDLFWILLAMGFGVLSHLLFILSELFLPLLAGITTQMGIYLFLFLLTFSVAQRMVPFFSHAIVSRDETLMQRLFGVLVVRILLESLYSGSGFIADIALGLLVAKELQRWQLQTPNPNPLLWILHTALYWVPIAFILGGISNLFRLLTDSTLLLLDIHSLVLGFVFTILIGFGTRVTLGHSGNPMHADRWTQRLFYATQAVVGVRIVVSLVAGFGWNFMPLFDLSVATWLLLCILWAVRFFAVLIVGRQLTPRGDA